MKHLSPEQIVDLADGCADAAAAAHAAACGTCGAKVEEIVEAIHFAGADRQHEPSPLFWPHLALRIGRAVRREHPRGASWSVWVWQRAPVGAMVVLMVAIGVGVGIRSGTRGDRVLAPELPDAMPTQAVVDASAEAGAADDPSWLLVSDLSADLSIEEAETSGALPVAGGVERALLHLDDAERRELARILREEMTPRGPAARQGPGA